MMSAGGVIEEAIDKMACVVVFDFCAFCENIIKSAGMVEEEEE